jgi:N-acetylneuraminic acid mutarotase
MLLRVSFLLIASLANADEVAGWKQLPPLPEPLGVAAPFAGTSGGVFAVAGGANFPDKMPWEGGKKVWTDVIWLLEKPEGAWRKVGTLPGPRAYGVSVSAGDAVICAGGSDAERHYRDVWRMVWRDGKVTIEPLPAMPIALAGGSGALVGNTLIMVGGAEQPGEQAATKRAFALDLAAKVPVWRELPPLPAEGRILAAAGVWKDHWWMDAFC